MGTKRTSWRSVPGAALPVMTAVTGVPVLTPLCILGVIRYIGPVHFEEGTWLGVELRSANGRNDGSVQGRRYFTCKPNHGLIVRPSKVTVRGINSAKLFEEQPHS